MSPHEYSSPVRFSSSVQYFMHFSGSSAICMFGLLSALCTPARDLAFLKPKVS